MYTNDSTPHTLRDVVAIWKRYRLLSITAFLSLLVLTVALIVLVPRLYYSSAMYLVRIGRESVALDATATVGDTVELHRTSDSEVRSTLEILRSHTLAEKVVDRVGVDAILETASPTDTNTAPTGLSRISGLLPTLDPIKDRERAVIMFRERLKVDSPNMSNVIAVSYHAGTPELALEVMRTVTDLFIVEHARLNRTEGTYEFFTEQQGLLLQQLEDAATRLQETKTEFGLASIEGRRRILENRIDQVEEAIFTNQQEHASTTARVQGLTEAISHLPEEVTLQRTRGVANAARDGMRQQLYNLELEERDLEAKLSDDHPKLKSIRAQREEAAAIYAEINDDRTETALGPNPNHQQISLELLTAKAQLAAQEARTEILTSQQAALVDELAELNRHEARVAQLSTEYEVAKERYEKHAVRLEQARLEEQLAGQSISSISVIEEPSHHDRPSFPSKMMFAILGTAMACLTAFCLPFVLNYFRTALSEPEASLAQVFLERVAVDQQGIRRGDTAHAAVHRTGREASLVGPGETDL